MSYTPIPGDVLRISGYYINAGQTAVITNYWIVGSTAGGGLSQSAIAGKFDPFYGALIPSMSSGSSYYGTQVQKRFPLPLVPFEFSKASAGPGTAGAVDLPKQTRFVISFVTGASGRAHRGRIYLPFPSQAFNQSNGIPTAAYQAFATTLGNVLSSTQPLIVGGATTTLNPVIFHRRSGSVDIITGNRNAQKWGTQRRSGDYGRLNPPGF